MNKIENVTLPDGFRKEYRRHLTLRILGTLGLFLGAALIAWKGDFSTFRYPVGGRFLLLALAVLLALLIFRIHTILFCSSWMGEITDIRAEMKIVRGHKALPTRKMVVTVTVQKKNGKRYTKDLVREDHEKNNLYQIHAPFKVGDRVLYLRGLRCFARYGVENAEELLDPKFVCPYCGEINGLERERCYSCGKIQIH